MLIIRTVEDMHAVIGKQRRAGRRIGFVPTMGNLHAGHYSLIERARQVSDLVVASIFVNPTQFGAHEDFSRYPRTIVQDQAGLTEHGCDVLFVPDVQTLYPFGTDHAVRVSVGNLGDVLEGASRPGHFDGVASVVTRLFHRVQPDLAVFGSKDYQQLLVIRRLSRDLCFPVEIIAAPIVREANGLAMSSRNQYLDAGQREQAAVIHATLQWISSRLDESVMPLSTIEAEGFAQLSAAGFSPDYVAIRRSHDLTEPSDAERVPLVILIAARLGDVRLIDNREWVASAAAK